MLTVFNCLLFYNLKPSAKLKNETGHQWKTGCPRPQGSSLPRPAKIYQTSGAEHGKVDFNTLKFERKDLNYPNYVLGISRFKLSAEKPLVNDHVLFVFVY